MSTAAERSGSPSDDPEQLASQARAAFLAVASAHAPGERADALTRFSGYIEYALVVAFRRVAAGDLDAPGAWLRPLTLVHAETRSYLAAPADACEQAAHWMEGVVSALRLGTGALEARRAVLRIGDTGRSGLEQAVIKLLASAARYLRRGEVYEQLPRALRPTNVRVGQVLNQLHHDGLLMRFHGRAKGNPDTAFYALAPPGHELAAKLGFVSSSVGTGPHAQMRPAVIERALDLCGGSERDWKTGVMQAAIANSREPQVRKRARERLCGRPLKRIEQQAACMASVHR